MMDVLHNCEMYLCLVSVTSTLQFREPRKRLIAAGKYTAESKQRIAKLFAFGRQAQLVTVTNGSRYIMIIGIGPVMIVSGRAVKSS